MSKKLPVTFGYDGPKGLITRQLHQDGGVIVSISFENRLGPADSDRHIDYFASGHAIIPVLRALKKEIQESYSLAFVRNIRYQPWVGGRRNFIVPEWQEFPVEKWPFSHIIKRKPDSSDLNNLYADKITYRKLRWLKEQVSAINFNHGKIKEGSRSLRKTVKIAQELLERCGEGLIKMRLL